MPLDPGLAGLLQFIEQAGHPPMHTGTADDARTGFLALTAAGLGPDGPAPVGAVEDVEIAGRRARVYRPDTDGPHPTVLFLHGGGWVIGDLETHDGACRRLCRDVDAVVVALDYRLAPEHPFPAAADDAVAAAAYLLEHLDDFGGDGRLAVAGDSAGGNLSAVVSQEVPGIAAQLLIYPATDAFGDYASREENAEGYFLDIPTMVWFLGHYVPTADSVAGHEHRLSPLHGRLAGLPPAVVVTAEFDPLRDEGEAYAEALRDAGVDVDVVRYDGMIHGFLDMGAFSPAAAAAVEDLHRRFRAALEQAEPARRSA